MIMAQNLCDDCPIPCSGRGRCHAEVRVCDDCWDKPADYIVDDDDLCEDCLIKRVKKDLAEQTADIIERVKKDLAEQTTNIEKRPDLYLMNAAHLLYDVVEKIEK